MQNLIESSVDGYVKKLEMGKKTGFSEQKSKMFTSWNSAFFLSNNLSQKYFFDLKLQQILSDLLLLLSRLLFLFRLNQI